MFTHEIPSVMQQEVNLTSKAAALGLLISVDKVYIHVRLRRLCAPQMEKVMRQSNQPVVKKGEVGPTTNDNTTTQSLSFRKRACVLLILSEGNAKSTNPY